MPKYTFARTKRGLPTSPRARNEVPAGP